MYESHLASELTADECFPTIYDMISACHCVLLYVATMYLITLQIKLPRGEGDLTSENIRI